VAGFLVVLAIADIADIARDRNKTPCSLDVRNANQHVESACWQNKPASCEHENH
jgi:hypothetical protein